MRRSPVLNSSLEQKMTELWTAKNIFKSSTLIWPCKLWSFYNNKSLIYYYISQKYSLYNTFYLLYTLMIFFYVSLSLRRQILKDKKKKKFVEGGGWGAILSKGFNYSNYCIFKLKIRTSMQFVRYNIYFLSNSM